MAKDLYGTTNAAALKTARFPPEKSALEVKKQAQSIPVFPGQVNKACSLCILHGQQKPCYQNRQGLKALGSYFLVKARLLLLFNADGKRSMNVAEKHVTCTEKTADAEKRWN